MDNWLWRRPAEDGRFLDARRLWLPLGRPERNRRWQVRSRFERGQDARANAFSRVLRRRTQGPFGCCVGHGLGCNPVFGLRSTAPVRDPAARVVLYRTALAAEHGFAFLECAVANRAKTLETQWANPGTSSVSVP